MSIQAVNTRTAINQVIAEALARSPMTVFLGETVRGLGAAGVAKGLHARFGDRQVMETPVSENGIFGAALGMALGGMRPVVEIYSADFLLGVANELMNDIAKWRQQQQAPAQLPIVVRGCMGANSGLGPEHSQCMESFLHHAPGLTIVAPSTPEDAAGLLRSALQADGPVVFLEHRKVYDIEAESALKPEHCIPLGEARVVRPGRDITLVAWSWMRHEAMWAADTLLQEGISCEVIDPRTVKPMDWPALTASVKRTGRLLVAEESAVTGSVSAEIIARMVTNPELRSIQCARVTMPDAIHPYSAEMEKSILPTSEEIVVAARTLVSESRRPAAVGL